MHGAVVLVAQLDQIVEVGAAVVDPVPDVVHVSELRVRTPGKATALVTPSDFDPLRVARVPPGSTKVEASTSLVVDGEQYLGVA
ncbi:MAG TPA: hypothetical protein VIX84_07760, partial [Acidimicrobiales bacterium]